MNPAAGRPAKKSLGQHFLTDPNLQRKIAAAIDPQPQDRLVEIGPGTGLLTRHLVGRVRHLTLVELDDQLGESLADEYADRADVELITADILDLSSIELAHGEPFKVIGNIPYGITSPLLFHLLEQHPRPSQIVLTVQREVADRLCARPATKQYGALTVGVQALATVQPLFAISRDAFRPRPDVESMAVRVTPLSPAPLTRAEEGLFRVLTRAAFSRRRKQLQKVLRQAPEYGLSNPEAEELLRSLDIDPATRPDALPVDDYVRLARALGPRP